MQVAINQGVCNSEYATLRAVVQKSPISLFYADGRCLTTLSFVIDKFGSCILKKSWSSVHACKATTDVGDGEGPVQHGPEQMGL